MVSRASRVVSSHATLPFATIIISLRGNVDVIPNFMVVHKEWKLILPKLANSKILDMLYFLRKVSETMKQMIMFVPHTLKQSEMN